MSPPHSGRRLTKMHLSQSQALAFDKMETEGLEIGNADDVLIVLAVIG